MLESQESRGNTVVSVVEPCISTTCDAPFCLLNSTNPPFHLRCNGGEELGHCDAQSSGLKG